jgi:hypothetical protein
MCIKVAHKSIPERFWQKTRRPKWMMAAEDLGDADLRSAMASTSYFV